MITNLIDFDNTAAGVQSKALEQGMAYTFKLGVGMKTVKITATVDEWSDTQTPVWLPQNENE